jgi:hypothetical protein
VTVNVPVVAPAEGETVVGDTVNEHVAPACVTVTGLLATVIVAVRGDVLVFAETLYRTVPLPVPVDPLVIVIHVALSLAVQAHPDVVVTDTALPVVPAADGDAVVGDTENEQFAPAWVTVNALPAIVSVPVRGDVAVLAVAENETTLEPEPFDPAVMVNHVALL